MAYEEILTKTAGDSYYLPKNTTIPAAANNGKLTIQANGSSKGTFTANQSGNTTVNITPADLGLSSAMKFLGVSSTAITNGGTENPTIGGTTITPVAGNVVIYNHLEFVRSTDGKWEQLGDESSYALKTSIGNGKITIKQGGTEKGSFTVNQSDATTIELTDNNTHYATKLVTGASSSASSNAAATNNNVYLNLFDNTILRNSHNIVGTGATTVTCDANGKITINSTDTNTNTTYSAGTGLSLSNTTFNVNTGYTTSGKNYAVKTDSNDNLYVNVPWENTWRGIQDNLTSDSATDSLSAKQGKALNTNKVNNTADGANGLINKLTEGTSAPTDADYYIAQYAGGGTTTTTYHRRPHSALWTYIKGKADGVYAKPANIGNGTITIKQAGSTKGSFSVNQSGNTTIELTDNNTTYSSLKNPYSLNFENSENPFYPGISYDGSKTVNTTIPDVVILNQVLKQLGINLKTGNWMTSIVGELEQCMAYNIPVLCYFNEELISENGTSEENPRGVFELVEINSAVLPFKAVFVGVNTSATTTNNSITTITATITSLNGAISWSIESKGLTSIIEVSTSSNEVKTDKNKIVELFSEYNHRANSYHNIQLFDSADERIAYLAYQDISYNSSTDYNMRLTFTSATENTIFLYQIALNSTDDAPEFLHTETPIINNIPIGSTSTRGVLKVGSNLTASSGTLSLTKANTISALGYTPCRAWTVTIPSGSSGSKAITVSGASFGKSPLIAKSSGSDTDYNKITAVSAATNSLTFTLSSATSAALTLMVIETF